ncbi:MAG: terminase small subunit [Nitrosopumilales archaeon]|nr:MAG: terminase small subunit [Nitrosopumilales archaeon]
MPRHVEGKLTTKQTRFIKEYIKTGNGMQSAIKAGYSKKTAGEMAYENLNKPQIKLKIEKAMSKEAEELGLNARYILSKLKEINDLKVTKNKKLAATILKSLELSGRHLNLFKDEKVVDMRLSDHRGIIQTLAEVEDE